MNGLNPWNDRLVGNAIKRMKNQSTKCTTKKWTRINHQSGYCKSGDGMEEAERRGNRLARTTWNMVQETGYSTVLVH